MDFLFFSVAMFLFAYMGMMHVFIALLGITVWVMGIYDLKTGFLSEVLAFWLGIPDATAFKGSRANFIPLFLAACLLIYSVFQIYEYGWINPEQQKILMQPFYSTYIILGVPALSILISILAAIWYLRDENKHKD